MDTTFPITVTDILGEVIQPVAPTFAPQFAQEVLEMHLSEESQSRVRDLLVRNNAGELNATEKSALENYLLVGQFLDLMQAKARLSLKTGKPAT